MTTQKQKALQELDKLKALHDALGVEEMKIHSVIPNFHESKYVETYEFLIEFLLNGWGESIGINKDVLSWHIYSNDWGSYQSRLHFFENGDISLFPNEDQGVVIYSNEDLVNFLFGNEE